MAAYFSMSESGWGAAKPTAAAEGHLPDAVQIGQLRNGRPRAAGRFAGIGGDALRSGERDDQYGRN